MRIYNILVLLLFITLSINTSAQTNIPKWKITDLEQYIKQSDNPTIISFWATFCKPCLEEIPYFQEAVKRYDPAGVQLLLVNLDMAEVYPKLQNFIIKRKISAPVVFLDETNADVFCPKVDEKWSGAIPASLLINNKTGYRKFFEDQLSREQLKNEIRVLIAVQ
ncbi:MAG: TlpA family protein disulfide reductase [Chitinophagaceae bacterium]|nr:TlpA family protein disulfide reductase [Chitinophagaceae bacterium]